MPAAFAREDAAATTRKGTQRQPSAPAVLPASGTVQVAFVPWDDAERLIVETIRQARQQVWVQTYMLSNKVIAGALIDAQRRGLDVQILVDAHQARQQRGSRLAELMQAGITVRLETRYRIAHNKIILTDVEGRHPAVVTGSFNFTEAAQRGNAENVLILRDHRELARAYQRNWLKHSLEAAEWEQSVNENGGKAEMGGKGGKSRGNETE